MHAAWKRGWPAWLAWGLWALAVLGLASVPWFDRLAGRAGRPDLAQLNASTIPWVVALVVAPRSGGAGRPPPAPPGRLAAAGRRAVGGRLGRGRRLRPLWAGRPARGAARRPL